jgi:HK97 gp10 family phage protein
MSDLMNVAGLKELQDSLKQLPDNIARNVLRGSVNAGASVIANEAKAKAPVYTGPVSEGHPPPGTLKRSIVQKQIKELSNLLQQTFFVTVRRGKKYQKQGKGGNLSQDAFYAAWVEWGTAKMMPARPFMRPAFESKKEAAVEAIKDYLAKRIPLEAAKLPFWRR